MITRSTYGAGTAVLILATCLFTGAVSAATRDVYTCSYINGADRDDLMAARDNLVRQADAIGLPEMQTFLWTPYKVADFDGDFLWFNQFADLGAFAAAADAYSSTDAGRAVQDRFDEIVRCSSSLVDIELVHDGGQADSLQAPVVVASYRCRLKPGQNSASVRDLVTHYKAVLGGTGMHDDHLFYAVTPRLGTGEYQAYFFGVHDDVASWSARETALEQSEAGQMFGRHANQVMDCGSALWWGEQLIPAAQ